MTSIYGETFRNQQELTWWRKVSREAYTLVTSSEHVVFIGGLDKLGQASSQVQICNLIDLKNPVGYLELTLGRVKPAVAFDS